VKKKNEGENRRQKEEEEVKTNDEENPKMLWSNLHNNSERIKKK
jgi:hypothetical protein